MTDHILIIGGGGREHALAWKLSQSKKISKIYVTPGNIGIACVEKVENISLDIKDHVTISEWCVNNHIKLVIVGPEDPLASGLGDSLLEKGVPCFGPCQKAAKIEANKEWAKKFMVKYNIPTARFNSFKNANEAKTFIQNADYPALVIKASGLAAGKGVTVAATKEEAFEAVDDILTKKKFGSAGDTIVVEELLEGEEISLLAFSDGKTVLPMLPAQDHKRLLEGDKGLNTGGMGAYCPCLLLTSKLKEQVVSEVLQRAIDGLQRENIKFVGVLYAGLMLTKSGPKVLEFNCRFGDPETQVILPLLESDLYEIMKSCTNETLERYDLVWKKDTFTAGVIMASEGYPESSTKGCVIKGLEEVCSLIFHSGTARNADGDIVTNGGRVLIAVSIARSLAEAVAKATTTCTLIHFEGAHFRKDIAFKGIARTLLTSGLMTYKSSGVDIVKGNHFVSKIKPLSKLTARNGCYGSLGSFGGVFDIFGAGYKTPLLVSGTDGVGTKLLIAQECNVHFTIGIDLVAMCVNDILANGAEPLYFLDYFSCSSLDIDVATDVIKGITEGCKMAGCALIGGETAELPGVYAEGAYDLAGFAVGAVARGHNLPHTDSIRPGDLVIGLPSSGVHSNGFSLIRKVMEKTKLKYKDIAPFSKSGKSLGEEFLTPTKIYVESLLPLMRSGKIKAAAHITGGGLFENIPRVLPGDVKVKLNSSSWKIPPVFPWLATFGGVSESELLKTLNCGIGMILIIAPDETDFVLSSLKKDNATVVGKVEAYSNGEEKVVVDQFVEEMDAEMRKYVPDLVESVSHKKRVAVLISGSGTNLQALIDETKSSFKNPSFEIVLVLSNKPNVTGLDRAQKADIPTMVIKHSDYKSRLEFDMAIHEVLCKQNIEIVCLAGFMRVLTSDFVSLWKGSLINIHPALLPSFKGLQAQKQALAAGVRVAGCTVHFVEAEVDAGGIIVQETVPVHRDDNEDTLTERIKSVEHKAYPLALELVASGKASLGSDGKVVWKEL